MIFQYIYIYITRLKYYKISAIYHGILQEQNTLNFQHSTKPIMILQLPRKCTAYIAYLPRPATHTTPAGRVLDGVRDQTQGSASHAFSCTGPGLVPVLPARCHRYVGASSSLRSGYCVLLIPSSYQKALLQYPTNNCKCGKEE